MPKAARTITTTRRMALAAGASMLAGASPSLSRQSPDSAVRAAAAQAMKIQATIDRVPSGTGLSLAANMEIEAQLERLMQAQDPYLEQVITLSATTSAGVFAKAAVVERYLADCKIEGFDLTRDQALAHSLVSDVLGLLSSTVQS